MGRRSFGGVLSLQLLGWATRWQRDGIATHTRDILEIYSLERVVLVLLERYCARSARTRTRY